LLLLRGRRREASRLLTAYVSRFRRPTAALEPDLERLRGELGVE